MILREVRRGMPYGADLPSFLAGMAFAAEMLRTKSVAFGSTGMDRTHAVPDAECERLANDARQLALEAPHRCG